MQGRGVAQGVAAYVSAVHGLPLAQGALHRVETTAMRASRTQDRRPHRQGRGLLSLVGIRGAAGQAAGKGLHVAAVLRVMPGNRADAGHDLVVQEPGDALGSVVHVIFSPIAGASGQLAVHVQGQMVHARQTQQLVFDHVVQLLQHQHGFKALGPLRHQLLGEGIRSSYLQELVGGKLQAPLRSPLLQHLQGLTGVCCGNAASHDAYRGCKSLLVLAFILLLGLRTTADELGVEGGKHRIGAEVIGHAGKTLVDLLMGGVGALGEDDPLGILLEAFLRDRTGLGRVRYVKIGGCVVDAGSGSEDDRRAVALGKVEGGLHHGKALVRGGRIEHRHLGKAGEPAGVLLGLGADGAGIVAHEQHQAALHAHVVHAEQGVGRNVQAHLLAGEQGAGAAVRCAAQQLQGRLFIGGPFHVHALGHTLGVELGHCFHQLGRGRSRVASHHPHACFQGGVGKGFVSHE